MRKRCGPAWLVGHSLGGLLSVLAACKRPDLARASGAARCADHRRLARAWSAGGQGHRADAAHLAGAGVAGAAALVAVARGGARALREEGRVRALGSARARGLRQVRLRAARRPDRAGLRPRRSKRASTTRCRTTWRACCGATRCNARWLSSAANNRWRSRQAGVAATRRLAGERFVWTAGTHLFPMEHPEATAAEVLRQLASMQAGGAGASRRPI